MWVGVPVGVGETPVPLSVTSCGLKGSGLSVNISLALRGPVVVGLNAVETVHVPLAAKLAVQVVAVLRKSPGFLHFPRLQCSKY